MIRSYIFLQFILSFMMIVNINSLSSPIPPFTNYTYSIELMTNASDLFWTVDNDTQMITFELHTHTTGWIGFGISPAGGMPGADICVGWIYPSGELVFQNRYAYGYETPVIDNATTVWFAIQGREQDGWTAIQFQRLVDTCDPLHLSIKSGTDIVIFAWGLVDPEPSGPNSDITYHQNRRGQRIIPLLSYIEPSTEDEFVGLDTVEFRVNNYTLPTDQSTYYCQVFKIPDTFPGKRHAIAREILIDSSVENLVYHLSLNECDGEAVFDDNNLPGGACGDNVAAYALCTDNIVIGWATGGDYLIEFPEEAGLPIGLNFSTKYYMIQINYYNADSGSGYFDNSGIRLYVGNELRPYDLGGITFGVDTSPSSISIPPGVNGFTIDSYCTSAASLYDFPDSGITVFSFFGHTHLQGVGLWTKVIRNGTAVEYLFNAESYNPNYQYEHKLPQPITVYPGDEFASRCIYDTMNRTEVTLGGHLPTQEMCVQVFNYYPRMNNLYTCATEIYPNVWEEVLNSTTVLNDTVLSEVLLNINWTSYLAMYWQLLYDTAPRLTAFGRAGYYNISFLPSLPMYQDINSIECENQQNNTNVTGSENTTNTTSMPFETTTSILFETTTSSVPTAASTTFTPTVATGASVTNTTVVTITVTTATHTSTTGGSNSLAVDKTIFILLLFILRFIYGIID